MATVPGAGPGLSQEPGARNFLPTFQVDGMECGVPALQVTASPMMPQWHPPVPCFKWVFLSCAELGVFALTILMLYY